ncbi:hypothetical protein PS9374_01858 [Planomonospora sphaerica]|uniref:Uncharacterized protein n=1 Tax=Planomonospora sphaerica TaxID=161355 RepID=A0A161LW07_9ACTN|nr:hypothetical protein [Planomonospora sphaerica]GAT66211.1 hypothetical protein PS9374_01858 [Planomonospora sphaerica]
MKTLREDLRALAEQAPAVDLAAQAVRGARRRRATRLALMAATVTCLIAGGGAALSQQVRPAPPIVLTPPETKALPLPAKGVAPVEQAYQLPCRSIRTGCPEPAWRLATRDGDTYELSKDATGPLEVTADGRRIVYYDSTQRRIVVRDLASGKTWQSPLKQPAEDFDVEYALRLSPDGLRFIISGWGGRREPNKLVDVARGTVTDLKRGWWPVSVSDGSGPVVLAKPYDMTSRVQVLGHDPITIPDFTYYYSTLAPDGRTLARLGQTAEMHKDGSIVLFDAMRGGRETRIPLTGIGEGLNPRWLGGWLNDTELTMVATPPEPRGPASTVYAVDVRTGASRELFTVRDAVRHVIPGLVR